MTNRQKRTRIKHWHYVMTKMQRVLDESNNAIGLKPEGNLQHSSICMMSALTLFTAQLVGDGDEWLDWFWLENGMGSKGFLAGYHGEEKPISSLDDLFWVMGVDGE